MFPPHFICQATTTGDHHWRMSRMKHAVECLRCSELVSDRMGTLLVCVACQQYLCKDCLGQAPYGIVRLPLYENPSLRAGYEAMPWHQRAAHTFRHGADSFSPKSDPPRATARAHQAKLCASCRSATSFGAGFASRARKHRPVEAPARLQDVGSRLSDPMRIIPTWADPRPSRSRRFHRIQPTTGSGLPSPCGPSHSKWFHQAVRLVAVHGPTRARALRSYVGHELQTLTSKP